MHGPLAVLVTIASVCIRLRSVRLLDKRQGPVNRVLWRRCGGLFPHAFQHQKAPYCVAPVGRLRRPKLRDWLDSNQEFTAAL